MNHLQAKENADDLMKQKSDLEREKRALDNSAAEKEVTWRKKISTIGNIVHDSVPVSDNEVRISLHNPILESVLIFFRIITLCNGHGCQRAARSRSVMFYRIMKF